MSHASQAQTGRVRIVARFAVQAQHVDEFKQKATRLLVEPTQGEEGCIEYQLCQELGDPTRFVMIETWESAESLDAHLAQPSLGAALGELMPMAAEAPVVSRVAPVAPIDDA